MEFGEQPVSLVGEEEDDSERKQLASGVLSSQVFGSSSCIQHREPASERACAYNQVEGGFVLSSVFVLFHAAFHTDVKRQNLKNRDRRRETRRERSARVGRGLTPSSLDHTGASRAWQDVRHHPQCLQNGD